VTMMVIINWLKSIFSNFYKGTFFVWFIWVLFFDNNSILNAIHSYNKKEKLISDTLYYHHKILEARKDREEVSGNEKMLEKWAREKYRMSRPSEDVYIIVDEENRSLDALE